MRVHVCLISACAYSNPGQTDFYQREDIVPSAVKKVVALEFDIKLLKYCPCLRGWVKEFVSRSGGGDGNSGVPRR